MQAAVHVREQAQYAVKVVENKSLSDEENLEALETEIKILRQLRHPHIVQLKEVVTTRDNTYLIMELLSGGELFQRIVDKGCFPEEEAAVLFAQIILSMDYLHSMNIVHRDVKPENFCMGLGRQSNQAASFLGRERGRDSRGTYQKAGSFAP